MNRNRTAPVLTSILLGMHAIMVISCSGTKDEADGYGTFEAIEVNVSSEVNGKIVQLNLEEGMIADSGMITVHIDSAEWTLKRLQLQAQLRAINARSGQVLSQIAVQEQQHRNLSLEKQRVEKLLKDGAATGKQLDDVKGAIELVEKQIESIKTQNAPVVNEAEALQKQIEQVELGLARCKVRNPLYGKVLLTYVQQGELAIAGRPLYKIANPDTMYLRVYLSGKQLAGVKTGQQVTVQTEGDETDLKKLAGVITWISEHAEFTPKIIQTREERVNLVYAVKVKVANDGYLRIGMPGELVLQAMEKN
jgi:HlyD family secretion protein